MTLKTSLFNLGIYLNSLKRFKWGSFLYFIMLFFLVPFIILVNDYDFLVERYIPSALPIIFNPSYMIFPLILTLIVPTVVSALIFNSVHSPKQSVFVHGLPAKREEIYISQILAGLTLMIIPIILNGLVLFIISLTKYSQIISVQSVFVWVLINISIIFIMFSVSAFTSFLTGNSAVHIGISIGIHLLPMLVSLLIYVISDVFLYGFVESKNFIATSILEKTPVVWFFAKILNSGADKNIFKEGIMWAYLIGSVVFYCLGFILYKKRKIEMSGEVVAFKTFKPIFKYTVTIAVAVMLFALFNEMNISVIYRYIAALVGTFISYFAIEMLMNKTFKVFSRYKGYIGFLVCASLFISFFAYTSVFGYEKRVPEISEIESAGAYRYWADKYPLVNDETLISDVIDIHKDIISDIPVVTKEYNGESIRLNITYNLKNGKSFERQYIVSLDTYEKAMAKMYKNKEYKLKDNNLYNINIENVKSLSLNNDKIVYDEVAVKIMQAVKKDVEELTFEQIETRNLIPVSIYLSVTAMDNQKFNIFKETEYSGKEMQYISYSFDITINSNFKNTYSALKEIGYYDEMANGIASDLWILKKPVTVNNQEYNYKGVAGKEYEFIISLEDCVKINYNDALIIAEEIINRERLINEDGANYYLFKNIANEKGTLWLSANIGMFKESELPELLKKYIQ